MRPTHSASKQGEPLRLHLGCGEEYLEGYVNIDFPPSEHAVMKVRADKYQDIRTLSYKENSVDEIRHNHVLEHFSRAEALKLLLRWRKWLKPGAKLVVRTPDFEKAAYAYIASRSSRRRFQLARHIFGSQEARWAYHLDLWDKEKFEFVLKKIGFKNLTFRQYGNSLARRFPRIPFLNLIGGLIPDQFYERYGGHKMPDIEATAEKDGGVSINDKEIAREILSRYLVGREGEKLLGVWLKEFDASP